MPSNPTVAVFGAYGHTGRFVVSELRRRGWTPVLSGRDAGKLAELAAASTDLESRPASIDDPASLDRALAGAAAVINCAGPFAATAAAVIDAALRARIHYLDVAAEVEVAVSTIGRYAEPARAAGIAIVPSAAFYGGLADLLTTAAMADMPAADEISIAYALDSWHPTKGTVATGRVSAGRREGRRLVFSGGQLELRADAAATTRWTFPEPFGTQAVQADFTTPDSVTVPHHLKVSEISSFMTLAPLGDLGGPRTDSADRAPLGPAVPGRGRRPSRRQAAPRRRARPGHLRGHRTHRGGNRRDASSTADPAAGVVTVGEMSDAAEFLRSLSPEHLTVELW